MNVLVTGGAGYIGSFMTRALLDRGFEVTVFDSLERGHRDALDSRAHFVQGDLKNIVDVQSMFKTQQFDAILHFAGYISVEESSKNPEKYYQNNVVGSDNLFKSAIETGKVKNFIFSSSAAVYGNPTIIPIPEDHPKNPVSPYGQSKLSTEEDLQTLRDQYAINFVCLRYFNACGAALDGSHGENHNPETHIIPLAIRAALNNSEFSLFGTDYKTPDGTCVRDYIHVLDLVTAHLLALEKIQKNPGGYCFNVGTGKGFSNKEVVEMVQKVSSIQFPIVYRDRREGDSDELIADVTKIKNELGFVPKYSDLETIVESAWKWHKK